MRVLHLVGSPTSDFFADLSRLYARGCLDALADDRRWEPHIAHVDPGGSWRFPESLDPEAIGAAPPLSLAAALRHIARLDPVIAVPQLFCLPGMTTYRALLDAIRLPYVGNRPDVMALAAHKPRAKAVVAAAGVAVPESRTVTRRDVHALDRAEQELPVVVKPADADNSDGITLVRDPGRLKDAIDAAFAHGDEVLVERYVDLGREVRCGVLDLEEGLQVLPLEEYAVDRTTKPVRDGADKLARHDAGVLTLVAKDAAHAWTLPVDDPLTEVVGAAARSAHRALGARHYSLFDFRIDPQGRPWFLEAGPYCSFSPASVVAVMAAAAGIAVDDLFARVVDRALNA